MKTARQRSITGPGAESLVVIGQIFVLSGLALSVLSFGGMEASTRSLSEVLICVAGLLLLSSREAIAEIASRNAFATSAPLVLLVFVSLRLLPAHHVQGTNELRFMWRSADPYATSTHLLIVIACCVSFYYGLLSSKSRNIERRLVYTLLALGTCEAFYGLVQYLTGWQKIFFYTKKYDLLEATGTYINRNHYAGLLEMVIPFSLSFCLFEYGKLARSGTGSRNRVRQLLARQGFARVVFWCALTVVLAAGLIVSRSRMGIVAAGASVAAMPLVRGVSVRKKVCISVFLICLFVGLVWMAGDPIAQRFAEINQEYTLSQGSRLAIWRDTVHLIEQHPWFGTGFGTFPTVYTRVQTTFLGNLVNHAHNDYLEIASDIGIPAALLIFGTIGLFGIVAASHAAKGPLTFEKAVMLACTGSIVAVLLHSLTDFNLYIPANALIFSSVLGLSKSQTAGAKVRPTPSMANASLACKRTFDVVVSTTLLAILFPVFVLIGLAVKMDSPGEVLFKVKAAGRFGKPFNQLKFRTMVNHDKDSGGYETCETDPRITPVGRLLRRWSLDELPQLFNVLTGDMSLVGPRPTLAEMLPRFSGQSARRFLVRPGLTGLAQIRGRNLLSWAERIAFDLEYVDRYTLWQDVEIIAATVPVCLSGEGIYGVDGRVKLPQFAECTDTCRDHV